MWCNSLTNGWKMHLVFCVFFGGGSVCNSLKRGQVNSTLRQVTLKYDSFSTSMTRLAQTSSCCVSIWHFRMSITVLIHVMYLHFLSYILFNLPFSFSPYIITFHLMVCENSCPWGFFILKLCNNHTVRKWLQTSITLCSAMIQFKHHWALAAELQ